MIRESILKESNANQRFFSKTKKSYKKSMFVQNEIAEPQLLMDTMDDSSDNLIDMIQDKIFSDTRITKDLFGKYLSIRLFLALLLTTKIFLGLLVYEFVALDPGNKTGVCRLAAVLNTVITLCSILVWILANFYNSKLKRERLDISENITYLQDYGYVRFGLVILAFLIHPFEPFIDVPFFWTESYFEYTGKFVNYDRPTIEYLIMFEFMFCILHVIKIILETIKHANNRAHRIARFFDIQIDTIYMLRSFMKSDPLLLVALMQVLGYIGFGVLIRIAESGYIKHIPPGLSDSDYTDEFDYRSKFFIYENSFWYIIISMSTIGYGDLFARSTYGRFIVIFAGIYGFLGTSLFVIAFTNLLTMQTDEDSAYTIVKSIQAVKDKNVAAVDLTSNILMAGCAYFNGDINQKTEYKEKFIGDIKHFITQFSTYRRLNMDEYSYISMKAFRIVTSLNRWDIVESIEEVERSKYQGLDD